MTEIEIIERAQMYLEKLANGIDPLTDKAIPDEEIINNVRISRCLHYVTGILNRITTTGSYEIKKSEFNLSRMQLARFEYSSTPLTISEMTKRLNDLVNPLESKPLKIGVITEWLLEAGMLYSVTIGNRHKKRVTDTGRSMGIISETRLNQQGVQYEAISYNLNAQHFITNNIEAIIDLNRRKNTANI